MPGLIKVGFTTTSLTQRLSELNTTGVPEDFIVGASFFMADPQSCESAVHSLLAQYRIRDQREFFRVDLKSALEASLPTILSYLVSEGPSIGKPSPISGLDEVDQGILSFLVHTKGGETWPELVARNMGIHQEEALLRLGELVSKGFLKERRESFSLTHKGRKYAFDNGIVVPDLLP